MINLHFFSYIHCIFQENKTKQKKLFCELLGKKKRKKKTEGPKILKMFTNQTKFWVNLLLKSSQSSLQNFLSCLDTKLSNQRWLLIELSRRADVAITSFVHGTSWSVPRERLTWILIEFQFKVETGLIQNSGKKKKKKPGRPNFVNIVTMLDCPVLGESMYT